MVLDSRSGVVKTVVFHPDGKHLLSGTSDGIRRWRLADGQEVGKELGMVIIYAIAVSRDGKWIVCGTFKGANVWDGEMRKKGIDVEGTSTVGAVDVSPDSTRFATGTDEDGASIWSIASGKRLVGPLNHDGLVNGIRFSPTGEHVATACHTGIHAFDSHTGDKLVSIKIDMPGWIAITPLAWSSDGQQIFAASTDNRIRSFNVSTGSQIAESRLLHDGNEDVYSIALVGDGKFIATFARHLISFLDTSTLTQISPVIEDSEQRWSIAVSVDSRYLATGQGGGKIILRDVSDILPDSAYGPFPVSSSVCAFILWACWRSPIPSPMLTDYIGTH